MYGIQCTVWWSKFLDKEIVWIQLQNPTNTTVFVCFSVRVVSDTQNMNRLAEPIFVGLTINSVDGDGVLLSWSRNSGSGRLAEDRRPWMSPKYDSNMNCKYNSFIHLAPRLCRHPFHCQSVWFTLSNMGRLNCHTPCLIVIFNMWQPGCCSTHPNKNSVLEWLSQVICSSKLELPTDCQSGGVSAGKYFSPADNGRKSRLIWDAVI